MAEKQKESKHGQDERREHKLIEDRILKLEDIRSKGVEPYPYHYVPTHHAKTIKEQHKLLKPEERTEEDVSVAGRIVLLRRMGKVSFITLRDGSGDIQLYVSKELVLDAAYDLLKKCDIGDIVGVKGTIFATKSGEITVEARSFTLLCKSLFPLPDKFHGLQDKELRYRRRHVDLIMNPQVRDVFVKRSKMISAIRSFLDERGFVEVETPLLQTQYGGASARPFVTHINAWNMPMYLSISPELYLKRLVVGGFEKVYTICKNFRNEGVDHAHNPEFTMIEVYEAYADYQDMMALTEECFAHVCKELHGTTVVTHTKEDGSTMALDFKPPWKRMTMIEAIEGVLGIDVAKKTVEELETFCAENQVPYDAPTWGSLVQSIFDELVEHTLAGPVHVFDRPKEATPLCKRHRADDRLNEQCEPICLGMEMGNIYSELNDPQLQEALLEEQAEKGRGGDEEAHPMDYDFLDAIKTGLPPTGGLGWGIDRMALVLLGQQSIRDVIFFPTMKPQADDEERADEEQNDKKER